MDPMLTAHRVRTSLVLGAAGATVLAALLLSARAPHATPPPSTATTADDGMQLVAELSTRRILLGAHDENLAILITAPRASSEHRVRPPLSLAIVIDRSGSMSGAPMEHAKRAASQLIGQLDPTDAFTVVAYSSGEQVVMPMSRATDANKAAARASIARIYDDGGTCISCGLVRGASELARSPIGDGLRRIVLISDGQANEGIWERGELAALAASTAEGGASISALGVGLDFDELTMQRIAEVGRGNYYFVEDTANLAAMFQRELGGLTQTVAADARLVLTEPTGVRIEEAYGYPMTREGSSVIIPIADLRAGETRKVVVRATVSTASTGWFTVAPVKLGWRRVRDGAPRSATTTVRAEVVTDAGQVAASAVAWAASAVEEALSARALEEASVVYENQGYEAAQQVLDRRVQAVRANAYVGKGSLQRIEAAASEAADSFKSAAPTKAKKLSRSRAYELAR